MHVQFIPQQSHMEKQEFAHPKVLSSTGAGWPEINTPRMGLAHFFSLISKSFWRAGRLAHPRSFFPSPLKLPFLCVPMAPFVRSLRPFLQISGLAVRRQRTTNPLQQAFSKDPAGLRGLATVFERSKPHVNIGMHQ